MKAHEYWSVGALITMLGTFYSGYKGSKSSHKYFASSSLLWTGETHQSSKRGFPTKREA